MIKDRDSFVLGIFAGFLILCFLMLALPQKRICEISVTKEGGHETTVHVGLLTKY